MKIFYKLLFPVLIIFIIALQATAGSSLYSKQAAQNKLMCTVTAKEENCARYLFLQSWSTLHDEFLDQSLNKQDWTRWKNKYLEKIKNKEDAYVAIETMVESLNDPYTRFLRPDDFQDQNTSIDAKICGIGVNITSLEGNTVILDVIGGTPAQKAGLKSGDIISKVDKVSVKGFRIRKVADLVRGKAGTNVELTIIRNKKPLKKVISREKFNVKSVNYKIIDKNIAYIKINSFLSQDTSKEVASAISNTDKAKGIIIDLRGNHGGLLQNAVIIADMFIKKGNVVSIVEKNHDKKDIDVESIGLFTNKPLVVLIDGESASASEILSGALKDHKRALLVGEKTFGKGLVQKVIPLPEKAGINITIAKYLTPNGSDINKIGIKPDYEIKYTRKDFFAKKDPQLKKAIAILKAVPAS
ncbi:MAG: S41 family peptidase [Candidatus Gastranaerophilaceae bacterium]|jgi:carboxyl-terminal processing protease